MIKKREELIQGNNNIYLASFIGDYGKQISDKIIT